MIRLLIEITIRARIVFLKPKRKNPRIIIRLLTRKLDIAILIFKYLFIRRFKIVIPPDEKPVLYIRAFVIPHIIPAMITDK